MVTIERNVDGCDTGHEMLQEYSEEVMSAGWNPQLVLAAIGATERISHYADDRGRTVIPESIRDFAPPEAMLDVADVIACLPSTAFPKCP